MQIPFIQREKTYEELQAEKERLDVEISVLERRRIAKKLRENGLTLKSFGNNIKEALQWLKNH